MLKRIEKTYLFLKKKLVSVPEIGIILGTGLGKLEEEIKISYVINYSDIPNFPLTIFLKN